MEAEHSFHSRMNRTLARDIVCYAEVCVTGVYPRDVLDQIHSRWESRYFAEYSKSSPSIAALISDDNRLIADAVILSLEDRREVVGLRLVLAIAGVSIGELHRGLSEERMPALTTGFCRFATSTLQSLSENSGTLEIEAIIGEAREFTRFMF